MDAIEETLSPRISMVGSGPPIKPVSLQPIQEANSTTGLKLEGNIITLSFQLLGINDNVKDNISVSTVVGRIIGWYKNKLYSNIPS